jgi:hypothetical protein
MRFSNRRKRRAAKDPSASLTRKHSLFSLLPSVKNRQFNAPALIDVNCSREYASDMRAVEFTTELGKKPVVTIPQEVADKLPKSGRARIIVLMPDDPEDALWRASAYEQFVREDSPEDAVYDSY